MNQFFPDYILLDGSAFLFRAYFTNRDQSLSNDEGFPTGAMFGVISSIKMLERQYPNAKLIVMFDAKGDNFRNRLYPLYKTNRKAMDDELRVQIEPLHQIIRAMGLPLLVIDDVEADDVIATLANWANEHRHKTIIASSDKDLYQLVNDNIHQMDMRQTRYDEDKVFEKMGVKTTQIRDFLALTGDSVDTIPGVPGVAPKTAIKWLHDYGDLEGVKQNAASIPGKVGERLRENLEELDLYQTLVSLKYDVPIDLATLERQPIDVPKLSELYQQYGFQMWLNQMDREIATAPAPTAQKSATNNAAVNTIVKEDNIAKENSAEVRVEKSFSLDAWQQIVISEQTQLDELIALINNRKVVVFDTETTSLEPMNACIVGLVFGVDNTAFYLPLAHDYMGAPDQLSLDETLTQLQAIFADDTIKKVGQNLKYDAHVLANYNITLNGIEDDTMLSSYCLNSLSRHNLDELSQHYLNHQTIAYKDITGTGKQQISFSEVAIDEAAPYACEDVIVTAELNRTLHHKLNAVQSLKTLYQTVEMPLINVLLMMERNGVKLDVDTLYKQQQQIKQTLTQVSEKAFSLANATFNLDSPKQIQQVLFSEEGLNIKPVKKTPKGQASTNEEALSALDHPLSDAILDYRALTKLNSTYLEALPKQINANTGRLHTSYHQAGTATGRLSSSKPNLQNIPIRSEQGRRVRTAFIAEKGNVIIAADYSQIELRIMAHLSQDKGLLNAFAHNVDVHKATASEMFGIELDQVDSDKRRHAKAINFGLIYGMGAFGLSKQINTSPKEAKKYMELYFEKYPGVLTYMENTQQSAKENGFVETILNRRLYLPQINASNKALQKRALRTAINAPMQGSAADIIKRAMLDIYQWLINDNPHLKMTMQVHDELVFEADKKHAESYAVHIQQLMQNAIKISVPLTVDIGIGNNWNEAH